MLLDRQILGWFTEYGADLFSRQEQNYETAVISVATEIGGAAGSLAADK